MEHWKLVETNKGRWLKNNTITLPSEFSNATSGSHCIHLYYTHVCICVARDFLPKYFSIEKLRLQEAQYWLFLNRDLCTTAAITLVQVNIVFLYREIMLFLRYRFKFFTCFPKMQQIILWLWCMNWNKRVRSERRKSHFRGPRFQNFPGEDTPGPPYKCEVLGISQLRNWIRPCF
jgi:hypothetical protein